MTESFTRTFLAKQRAMYERFNSTPSQWDVKDGVGGRPAIKALIEDNIAHYAKKMVYNETYQDLSRSEIEKETGPVIKKMLSSVYRDKPY